MVAEGIVETDAGRTVDQVCQVFPADGIPAKSLAKAVETFLHPNDISIREEPGNLVSRFPVGAQNADQGLIIEHIPVDGLSN